MREEQTNKLMVTKKYTPICDDVFLIDLYKIFLTCEYKMTPQNIIKVLLEYDEDFFLDPSDKALLIKDIKCVIDDSENKGELIESLLMVFEEYNPSFTEYRDEVKKAISL